MAKTESVEIPSFWAYMQPTLDVLRERDGSATNQELVDLAAAKMGLSTEQVSVPHDPEKGTPSEVAYRMAWARSYLKKAGLLDNTEHGVWSLTEKGRNSEHVDGREIACEVRSGYIPRGRVSSDDDVAETYLFAWNRRASNGRLLTIRSARSVTALPTIDGAAAAPRTSRQVAGSS